MKARAVDYKFPPWTRQTIRRSRSRRSATCSDKSECRRATERSGRLAGPSAGCASCTARMDQPVKAGTADRTQLGRPSAMLARCQAHAPDARRSSESASTSRRLRNRIYPRVRVEKRNRERAGAQEDESD